MTGYYSHKAVEDLAPPPTGPAPRARRADDSVEPPFIPLCSVMDEHICRAHDDAYLHHSPLTRPFSDETTEHSVGECDACAEWNPPPRVRQFGSSAVTGSGAVPAGAQGAVTDGEARDRLIRLAVAEGGSLREVGGLAGISHTAVKFIAHGRPSK